MSNTKYNYTRKFITSSGQITTDDNNKDIVAKEVINDDTKNIRYYIKFIKGRILNPRKSDYYRKKTYAEFRMVKTEVYSSYIKYLINGGESYLRAAERGMV